MFKLFESKEEKSYHFLSLIENEDYTSIFEKMEQGYKMENEESNLFDKKVGNKIQNEGLIFLSNLYKEGFEISDEWLLRWTKTKKFITNYNIPVYGSEYFKQRLEKMAPEILSYFLYRMDNLYGGISNSYKVELIQAIEVLTSVRNYTKLIEHIESGISDKNFTEYFNNLKKLNNLIEERPSFYNDLNTNLRVSDCLENLEIIMKKRELSKKEKSVTIKKEIVIPDNIQEYISRIYDNYEKCIYHSKYLKKETIDLLEKIKEEKVLFLINNYKENEDKILFTNEIKKIDNALSAVLVGINKQIIADVNKEKSLKSVQKK